MGAAKRKDHPMPKAGEVVEMEFAEPEDAIIRQPGEHEAERTLWFAVLEQAFRDAIGDSKEIPALWRGDAMVWFRSNATTVGSLRWIVAATGIETTVEAIRERVAKGGGIGRARRQYRDA